MTRKEAVIGVPARLVGVDGAVHAVTLDLGWDIADPLIARLAFHVAGHPDEEWIAARDLIADGINSPDEVGVGELRLRGERDEKGELTGSTLILLRSETGPEFAEVSVANEHLTRFIDAAEDACPAGSFREKLCLAIWVNLLLLSWGFTCEDAA